MVEKVNHKNFFIIGSFIATISVAFISLLFNLYFNKYFNLKVNLIYLFLLLVSLFIFIKKRDVNLAAVMIFWISTAAEVIFLLTIKADINLIYIILLPIIIYMVLPLRALIVNLTLFYLLITFILYYEYTLHTESFLHNSKYLFNFIIANIIILFYGFLYNLAINRFIEHLKSLNEQKNLLLKEVHHRVKNNLNLISSIIGLSYIRANSDDAKEILRANQLRIDSMAKLHEILYKNENLDKIEAKEYLSKLVEYILKAEDAQRDKEFRVKLDIENININMDSMLLFGVIINELITNSIKHSECKNGLCEITISFRKKNDGYEFIYFDNTQSVDKTKLKSGFGNNLIELSIMQLKGKVQIDISKGLKYIIYFPKEAVDLWQS